MKKLLHSFLIMSFLACFSSCKNAEKNDNSSNVATPAKENKVVKKKEVKPDPATAESVAAGASVYTQNCAVCHQKSGGGVPNLNPPLKGADYTMGDKEPIITLLLKGSSDEPIKVNGKTYSNVMPSFSSLNNDQIANVLTYVRNSFGNQATAVKVPEVEEIRASLK